MPNCCTNRSVAHRCTQYLRNAFQLANLPSTAVNISSCLETKVSSNNTTPRNPDGIFRIPISSATTRVIAGNKPPAFFLETPPRCARLLPASEHAYRKT